MNKTICLAPWVHAHITATGQRRICCVSKESNPVEASNSSLVEYWNSTLLKDIRLKMLAGEKIEACRACEKITPDHSVLKDFYNDKFLNFFSLIPSVTREDGSVSSEPFSFDYRSNLCNFKCRMCGPDSSSSWRIEKKLPLLSINESYIEQSDRDIYKQIEDKKIKEIYWAGGEPLIMKRHWDIMNKIISAGHAHEVDIRYNTNLSKIEWQGQKLTELIKNFKSVSLNASIDAAGKIGEFIRTGLSWDEWQKHISTLKSYSGDNLKLTLDLTLTLPGIFGLKEMLQYAHDVDLELTAKLTSSGGAHNYLSPLALPKNILHNLIDQKITELNSLKSEKNRGVFNLLYQLKQMTPLEEKFDSKFFKTSMQKSFRHEKNISTLRENHSNPGLIIENIYAASPEVLKWWLSFAD